MPAAVSALRTARDARALSLALGCPVRPCGRPGSVEARGLPGAWSLVGTPEEVAAEGRRLLLAAWLRVLGTQGRPAT